MKMTTHNTTTPLGLELVKGETLDARNKRGRLVPFRGPCVLTMISVVGANPSPMISVSNGRYTRGVKAEDWMTAAAPLGLDCPGALCFTVKGIKEGEGDRIYPTDNLIPPMSYFIMERASNRGDGLTDIVFRQITFGEGGAVVPGLSTSGVVNHKRTEHYVWVPIDQAGSIGRYARKTTLLGDLLCNKLERNPKALQSPLAFEVGQDFRDGHGNGLLWTICQVCPGGAYASHTREDGRTEKTWISDYDTHFVLVEPDPVGEAPPSPADLVGIASKASRDLCEVMAELRRVVNDDLWERLRGVRGDLWRIELRLEDAVTRAKAEADREKLVEIHKALGEVLGQEEE